MAAPNWDQTSSLSASQDVTFWVFLASLALPLSPACLPLLVSLSGQSFFLVACAFFFAELEGLSTATAGFSFFAGFPSSSESSEEDNEEDEEDEEAGFFFGWPQFLPAAGGLFLSLPVTLA